MKIIYFLLLSLIYCSKLDNLFEESTKLLLELADKMKKKYFQRCSDKCICSVLSCSNGYEANFCSKAFDEEGCNCPGHRVNLDKLTTHIGNIYQTDEEIIQKVRTDESFRTTMCYANQLEEVIKKYEIPKEIFKIYFATTNGLFLSYPGLPDCRKYDHRVRPWWIGTITGSKNIIFLIDISKEVTSEKFTLMKEASSTILSFSNKSDKISLIPYDNKIYPGIYGLDGSLSNQNIIKDFLDKLTITNYPSDFHSVISSFFIKLREMKLNGNLMVSDIFIVNLTAGVPKSETTEVKTDNQNTKDKENITEEDLNKHIHIEQEIDKHLDYGIFELEETIQIESLNTFELWEKQIKYLDTFSKILLYNYSFTEKDQSHFIYKILSCYTNGISGVINSKKEIFDQFNKFALTMTTGIKNEVYWTAPYLNSNGKENVTTAGFAIIDEDAKPRSLIGVIALDIYLKDLLPLIDNDHFFLDELILFKSRKYLTLFDLNKCEIDYLRNQKEKCLSIESKKFCPNLDSDFMNIPKCSNKKQTNVVCIGDDKFELNKLYDVKFCCNNCNTYKIVIYLLVAVFVIMLIVWIITLYSLKEKKPEINLENSNKFLKMYLTNLIFEDDCCELKKIENDHEKKD